MYLSILPEYNGRTISLFILTTVLFALFQALFYVLLGENVLFKCYPVLIHIPLILIIRYICHQNIYISFIAVMSAYLMCTPRKWFGTLAKYIFPEIPVISDVVTIVITIPLLIVVIKYISPYIIKLKEESKNIISMFFLLPLTYYILEYALTVYTNLLYTGKAVIIEFMDSFIVVLYFFLSIVTLSMSKKKIQQSVKTSYFPQLQLRLKKKYLSLQIIRNRLRYTDMT